MSTKITKKSKLSREIILPEGVSATYNDYVLSVKGSLGTSEKDFRLIMVNLKLQDDKVMLTAFSSRKKSLAILGTGFSLVTNMIFGVQHGYTYKLKTAYAHFPITVSADQEKVKIDNFYGERSPRFANILGSTKVSVDGDTLTVSGISLEDVSQTAANVEQVTKIKRKDQRIFLDGIYIFEKERGSNVN